ncbi:MAG: DUF4956 domain-containing protein [Ruminococcaceae bacterium]|nr:DUF4956 domain-containing protein [Oscillospiraceae bacterium]
MNYVDIFKNSFLNAFSTEGLPVPFIVSSLVLSAVIGMYIFLVYRLLTRKTFYSKNFNVALVAMTIITTAIILAMQASIVISLGMVGALSIVRFRTAIKDPMDLVYLYWAIGVGIICGAGLAELACIVSVGLTAVILFLDYLPTARAPMMLVINADERSAEGDILAVVKQYSSVVRVKSRNITNGKLDMVMELRVKDESGLIQAVADIPAVSFSSLLAHDGEVTF